MQVLNLDKGLVKEKVTENIDCLQLNETTKSFWRSMKREKDVTSFVLV